jgi:hypothetical protein
MPKRIKLLDLIWSTVLDLVGYITSDRGFLIDTCLNSLLGIFFILD